MVCAAVLHSNRLETASDAEIAKCAEVLINASHYKFYHSSLAYTFLLELLDRLNESQFEQLLWPQMQKEMKRPWEKQNINTVHFLMKCQSKYPAMADDEFLQSSLQTNEILTPLAYKHLSRLFWSPASIMIAATHPSYEAFGRFLATNVPEKKLSDFWQKEINEILLSPTKLKEVVTLRLLTILFNESKISPKTAIKLLSNSFISMITKSIRTIRQQKQTDYTNSSYSEFFDSVEKYLQDRTGITEKEKVEIIQRFVDHPGTLTIEKFTPNRIIHKFIGQLKAEGVHQMFEFYKSILLGRKDPKKSENWLHFEIEHCIQMLQTLLMLRSVHKDHEWRAEQLKFLFKYGLFYVNKHTDALVSKDSKDVKSNVLPTDVAFKLKNAFYASLQSKYHNLEVERTALLSIVEFCNEQLQIKSISKSLRHPLADETRQAWNKMYSNVTAKKKAKKISFNVFDVVMIHMGLQLFVDPSMAIFSIDDLEKCIERAHSKVKKVSTNEDGSEAEWIEVVVDLFLQLLSQNKGFLRSVVDNVFPELCQHLNVPAIDHILVMLDMNEKNPLTPQGATAEESDNEDDDDSDDVEKSGNEDDDDDDENSDQDNADSSDEENITDEDEGTVNDQLRSVVLQALGGAGQETDTESIDLNDMDDDEADRLDSVLSEAFKSVRKDTGSGKKKTKLERTTNTTVMHFRIRVLDLIEIYLKTNPTLAITLNILTDLIPMYENCAGNKDMEPLTRRLQHVLKLLYNLKEFKNTADVTEAKLYDLFEMVIAIKSNSSAIGEPNKLRSNLCGFLITVSQLLKSNDPILLEGIAGYLEQFLKSRNPRVQFSSFQNILRNRWVGVWRLGQIIAKTILSNVKGSRPFRRAQGIELLSIIYKNHGFISSEVNEFNEYNEKIEGAIRSYIQWLNSEQQTSSKEFTALLQLLQEIHKCSETIAGYECKLEWTSLCEMVQSIRCRTDVDSYQVYFGFCKRFGLKDIKNSEVQVTKKNGTSKIANGVSKDEDQDQDDDGEDENENEDSEEMEEEAAPVTTNGVAKKRKAKPVANGLSKKRKAKLDKKLRKQSRLAMSSVGLEDQAFKFTSGQVDVAMD